MKKSLPLVKSFLRVLNPSPYIGGLEASDSELRFISLKSSKATSLIVRLPQGVMVDGRIKEGAAFKDTLLKLRDQITQKRKKLIPVIVNIPDINIYAQVFTLPLVASANLEEAAELNLRMISPIAYESAYSDWQKVGEREAGGGEIEILGVFVLKGIIDEFIRYLKEANFSVAAIEFPALAISRLFTPGSSDATQSGKSQSVVLLRLSSNGFSYSVVRGGKLYFSHATNWREERIYLTELEDLLVKETQKVLNFYNSRWQMPIDNFVLVCPNQTLEEKIAKIIKNHFSLETSPLQSVIDPKFQKMNLPLFIADWFGVVGSAIRGLVPRAEDYEISLAGIDVQDEFRQAQLINFIKIWHYIATTVLSTILLIFLAAGLFLVRTENNLKRQLSELAAPTPVNQVLNTLKEEARLFNEKIDLIARAKSQTSDWSPFLEKILNSAGNQITIDRISIQSLDAPILLTGRAVKEDLIVAFKNRLSGDSGFSDVDLPLSKITSLGDSVGFTITFRIKKE